MSVLDSLKKWFSVVTNPLGGANKVADDLNNAHQDFMRGFASIMTNMMAQQVAVKAANCTATDLATAMSGDGAEAIRSEALSYLQVSASVTPTPDLVLAGVSVQGASQGANEVSQLTEFGNLSSKAVADIEEALENAAEKIGEDAALDTVTEVVDGAAIAEAGANPIADAVAIILTIIAAAFFLKTLYDMAWAIYDAIQTWQKAATNASRPLPHLPQKPQQPTPQMLSLTQEQEKDLETLIHEFPKVSPDDIKGLLLAGFSADEIRAILRAGFTHAQIQTIINRIKTAQKDPHGTDKLGLTDAQIRDLVNRVAAAINSSSPQQQLEGLVAKPLIADLVSFQRQIVDPATGEVVGEIDVETSNAIIEVSTTDESKLQQVLKEKDNKLINPKGKQVILYAPRYSHHADAQFKSYGIPIIRSFKDLFDYLRGL